MNTKITKENKSEGAMFSPYLHYSVPSYTGSPRIILELPPPPPPFPSTLVAEYPRMPELHQQSRDYPATPLPPTQHPLWQNIPERQGNTKGKGNTFPPPQRES